MKLKFISTVMATTVLLAACAENNTVSSSAPETASQFMTQDQLLATIPGAVLYGTSSNDGETQWVASYSKGGTSGEISGLWGDDPYKSTWYVKDGMWCEKSDTFEGCWSMVQVGAKELQPYKDGTEKLKNTWLIK